ncbi:transmembrane protein, putative (macronuclear) [Tetrahymena thermophila SB210]|uniref:Transmembrane protein, putative n=1 Tax=Tetrahymena thermophila (strain SB210) TaxID=312017 RepID=I7LSY3_TETTS|nr:transmembrane protein, putative [Tetrahymena thermophila SB210]EAR83842.2 transmembrane protein, putative [Tetrahymena thermophila SB210]|eukprot:XP_001031505.2 transmembrane protein, putative [Tetrahymena thermophila SB210]
MKISKGLRFILFMILSTAFNCYSEMQQLIDRTIIGDCSSQQEQRYQYNVQLTDNQQPYSLSFFVNLQNQQSIPKYNILQVASNTYMWNLQVNSLSNYLEIVTSTSLSLQSPLNIQVNSLYSSWISVQVSVSLTGISLRVQSTRDQQQEITQQFITSLSQHPLAFTVSIANYLYNSAYSFCGQIQTLKFYKNIHISNLVSQKSKQSFAISDQSEKVAEYLFDEIQQSNTISYPYDPMMLIRDYSAWQNDIDLTNISIAVASRDTSTTSLIIHKDGEVPLPSFQINSLFQPSYTIAIRFMATLANNPILLQRVNNQGQYTISIQAQGLDVQFCQKTNECTTFTGVLVGDNTLQLLVFTVETSFSQNVVTLYTNGNSLSQQIVNLDPQFMTESYSDQFYFGSKLNSQANDPTAFINRLLIMKSTNALQGPDASAVVDNCQLSIGNNPFICLTCNTGYYLYNGTCLTSAQCISIGRNPTQDFYCAKACNSQCLTCLANNPNQCITCSANRINPPLCQCPFNTINHPHIDYCQQYTKNREVDIQEITVSSSGVQTVYFSKAFQTTPQVAIFLQSIQTSTGVNNNQLLYSFSQVQISNINTSSFQLQINDFSNLNIASLNYKFIASVDTNNLQISSLTINQSNLSQFLSSLNTLSINVTSVFSSQIQSLSSSLLNLEILFGIAGFQSFAQTEILPWIRLSLDNNLNIVGSIQQNKIKSLTISLVFVKKDSHYPNIRNFNVNNFGFQPVSNPTQVFQSQTDNFIAQSNVQYPFISSIIDLEMKNDYSFQLWTSYNIIQNQKYYSQNIITTPSAILYQNYFSALTFYLAKRCNQNCQICFIDGKTCLSYKIIENQCFNTQTQQYQDLFTLPQSEQCSDINGVCQATNSGVCFICSSLSTLIGTGNCIQVIKDISVSSQDLIPTYYQSAQISQQSQGCSYTINNQCSQCNFGYIFISNKCVRCPLYNDQSLSFCGQVTNNCNQVCFDCLQISPLINIPQQFYSNAFTCTKLVDLHNYSITLPSNQSSFYIDQSTLDIKQNAYQCFQNCQQCINSSTCINCNQGYTLSLDSQSCIPCSSLHQMCTQCFYGALINDQTFIYSQNNISLLSPQQMQLLQLRCSSVQPGYYITSDLLKVNQCPSPDTCKECVLGWYNSFTGGGQQIIYNSQQSSQFQIRCSLCKDPINMILNVDGTSCIQSKINNCNIQGFGTVQQLLIDQIWYSLNNIQPSSLNFYCYECNTGYTLSADKQQCIQGCSANFCNSCFMDSNSNVYCNKCQNNYLLDTQTNTCSIEMTCQNQIQYCNSCFKYGIQNSNYSSNQVLPISLCNSCTTSTVSISCPQNCLSCDSYSSQCIQCMPNYQLDLMGNCQQANSLFSSQVSGQQLSNLIRTVNYVSSFDRCQSCPLNCISCYQGDKYFNVQNYLQNIKYSQTLTLDSKINLQNLYGSRLICLKCQSGYIINSQGFCQQSCGSMCNSCDSNMNCIQCSTNLKLTNQQQSIMQLLIVNFYPSLTINNFLQPTGNNCQISHPICQISAAISMDQSFSTNIYSQLYQNGCLKCSQNLVSSIYGVNSQTVYNSNLRRCTTCHKTNGCIRTFTKTTYFTCQSQKNSITQDGSKQNPYSLDKLNSQGDIFYPNILDLTQQILYLLELGIEEMEIDIILISTLYQGQSNCVLEGSVTINTNLLEQVLGLKKLTLNLKSDDPNNSFIFNLNSNENLKIQGFTDVNIQNLQFMSSLQVIKQSQISLNTGVNLSISNCNFTNTQTFIQIGGQFSQVQLLSCIFTSVELVKDNSLIDILPSISLPDSFPHLSINIAQSQIIQSSFLSNGLLNIISPNFKVQITLNQLTILNSIFGASSYLISSEQQSSQPNKSIQMSINNLNFTNNQISSYQPTLFYIQDATNIQIKDFTIQNCNIIQLFNQTSSLIASSLLSINGGTISNFYLINNTISYTKILQSASIQSGQQYQAAQSNNQQKIIYIMQLSNIQFYNNTIISSPSQGVNFYLAQFGNIQQQHLQLEVQIQNLNVTQNFFQYTLIQTTSNTNKRNLQLQNDIGKSIEEIQMYQQQKQVRTLQTVDQYTQSYPFQNENSLIMVQSIYLFNLTQTQIQETPQIKLLIADQIFQLIISMLSISSAALQQYPGLLKISSIYSNFNFQNFNISNVYSQKSIIQIDQKDIYVDSKNIQNYLPNGIQITGIQFQQIKFNLLTYGSVVSAIQFEDINQSMLNMTNIIINSTSIDQPSFVPNQILSNGLLIQSQSSTVILNHGQILNSQTFVGSNGMYISAKVIQIQNSAFANANQNINNLSQIIVQGGFGTLQAYSQLMIQGTTFTQSFANYGGALYIIAQQGCQVNIQGSTFANNQCAQNGGAIYFLSQTINNSFTVGGNSVFQSCQAGFFGGCLYFDVISLTQITISQSTISSSQARNFDVLSLQPQGQSCSLKMDGVIINGQNSSNKIAIQATNLINIDVNNVQANLLYQQILYFEQITTVTITNSVFGNSQFYQKVIIDIENCNTLHLNNTSLSQSTYTNGYKLKSLYIFANIQDISVFNLVCAQQFCLTCYTGIIFFQYSNSLSISNSTFTNNTAFFGGAIYIHHNIVSSTDLLKNYQLNLNKIQHTNFTNNTASYWGGAIYLEKVNQMQFYNNIFQLNQAMQGAGIYNANPQHHFNILLRKNSFIQNLATQVGAAIYSQFCIIYSQAYPSSSLFVNLTDYNYYSYITQTFTGFTNTFSNNSALMYGNNIYTFPQYIRYLYAETQSIIDFSDKSPIKRIQVSSGQPLSQLYIIFVDEDYRIINKIFSISSNSTYLQIQLQIKDNGFNLENNMVTFSNQTGYFDGSNSVLNAQQLNQTTSIICQSSLIQQNPLSSQIPFEIPIQFNQCNQGEELIINDEGWQTCSQCLEGFYSLVQSQKCKFCIYLDGSTEQTVCPGGSTILLPPGYWRSDNQSEQIVECINNPANCIGNRQQDISSRDSSFPIPQSSMIDINNFYCDEGCYGALCQVCDIKGQIWGVSYSNYQEFSCFKCSNAGILSFKLIWSILLFVFLLLLSAKSAYLVFSNGVFSHVMIKSVFLQGESKEAVHAIKSFNPSGIYLKMIMNYLQVISVLLNFQISLPNSVSNMNINIYNPFSGMGNTWDCVIKIFQPVMPFNYFRVLWFVIAPLILIVIFIGIYYILQKYNMMKYKITIVYSILCYLFLYVQPPIVSSLLSQIACINIAGQSYIKGSTDRICYDDDYYYYGVFLIAPFLIIWIILLPGVLFIKLYMIRRKLYYIRSKIILGFFYSDYKTKFFYWEIFRMGYRILIIATENILYEKIHEKAMILVLIVYFYQRIHKKYNPYLTQDLNRLEKKITQVILISFILGRLAYSNPYPTIQYMCLIVLVLINFWLFLYLIRRLIQSYSKQLELMISYIKVQIFRRLPKVGKFFKLSGISIIQSQNLWKKVQNYVWDFFERKEKDKTVKLFDQTLYVKYDEEQQENNEPLIIKQKRQWEESQRKYLLQKQEERSKQMNSSYFNQNQCADSILQIDAQSINNTNISPLISNFNTPRQEDKLLMDQTQVSQVSIFNLMHQTNELSKRENVKETKEQKTNFRKESKEEDISFSQESERQQDFYFIESKIKDYSRRISDENAEQLSQQVQINSNDGSNLILEKKSNQS